MLAELAEGSRKGSKTLLDTRAPRAFYRSRSAGSHAKLIAYDPGDTHVPRTAHRVIFREGVGEIALSRAAALLTTPSSILRPRTIVRGGTG